jgi:elongation factor G
MPSVPSFRPQDLRNIALIGRAGAGKTTLAEALLHRLGAITRMGSVEASTTISDFEPEAQKHHHSISATLLFATKDGREINIIDTPGHPDFVGHALAALPAVETAVLVTDAGAGIDLATRRLYNAAGELGLARMVVVNKIDQNLARLPRILDELRAALGPNLHCVNLPTAGGTDVIDCFDHAAGTGRFRLGGRRSTKRCSSRASRSTTPCSSATSAASDRSAEPARVLRRGDGPRPRRAGAVHQRHHRGRGRRPGPRPRRGGAQPGQRPPAPLAPGRAARSSSRATPRLPLIAHVWKVANDPYAGKLAMIRVLQGTLTARPRSWSPATVKPRKAGQVLKVEGREHPEIEGQVAYAGDLIALARIDDLHVDALLHAPGVAEDLAPIKPRYPAPVLSLALDAATKADDAKLGSALQRLCEEDPTLVAGQDRQTRDYVLSGQGELHLKVVLEKLKNRFGVSVTTRAPRVSYRETITAVAEGHFRLKKQTGGAGQFAEVFLRIEPRGRGEGFEFVDDVFGGAIPHQFLERGRAGIHDALEAGTLSGSPVQDVRVVITDGKAHSVDSKDIAFRNAAKLAFRDAYARARPLLLEPIVNLEIIVPELHTGTVTTDLKNMRGKVLGFDTLPDGVVQIHAQAPLAEVGNYVGQLRGATAGQGSFTMELAHHDVAPPAIAQKVAAAYKPHPEE